MTATTVLFKRRLFIVIRGNEHTRERSKRMESLIELRKSKSLSQEEMAGEFQFIPMTYSQWKTRKNVPDLSIAIGMLDYFAVPVDYLLSQESNEPTPKESKSLKAADILNETLDRHQKLSASNENSSGTTNEKSQEQTAANKLSSQVVFQNTTASCIQKIHFN